MARVYPYLSSVIAAVLLMTVISFPAVAATLPEYTIAYTITVQSDGSALWQVEYRTLLSTNEDLAAFEEYSNNIDTVYLPELKNLMEQSIARASVATSRSMAVKDFRGTSDVQTAPTGRYGVVLYSFAWTGFARPGTGLTIGDAFAGGMYLPKDASLTLRYPDGYSVKSAVPVPDLARDGLVWYGQRSFGAGEPHIVLEQTAFPILPVAAGLILIIIVGFTGFSIYHRKKQKPVPDEPDPAPDPLSETEILDLEERTIQLLRSHGGEMFQSDIVKNLGLPKSTVSSGLNSLHTRGIIIKVRKGRENLIRLV